MSVMKRINAQEIENGVSRSSDLFSSFQPPKVSSRNAI